MNQEDKTLIIASFVLKTNIETFIKKLKDKFNLKETNVFVYEIENEENELLLTFKIKTNKKIDLKYHFNNATIVNIKNGCIFSINGLNRLIERETDCEQGNADYKNYTVYWNIYKNTIILSNKNKLVIKKIKKIENDSEKNKT